MADAPPDLVLVFERIPRAKVWAARIKGKGGYIATASSLPGVLVEVARKVPELAEEHNKPDWLDWPPPRFAARLSGDYV